MDRREDSMSHYSDTSPSQKMIVDHNTLVLSKCLSIRLERSPKIDNMVKFRNPEPLHTVIKQEETCFLIKNEKEKCISIKEQDNDFINNTGNEIDQENMEIEDNELIFIPDTLSQIENCVIIDLLVTPFQFRSVEEKYMIFKEGRPTVSIPDFKIIGYGFSDIDNFFNKMYETTNWLCGSRVAKKLYCWTCLLFNNSENESNWTKIGVDIIDSNVFKTKVLLEHDLSESHIRSYVLYCTFSADPMVASFNSEKELTNLVKYNKSTEIQYKELIKRLADATIFLVTSESLSCRYMKDTDSVKEYNFNKLLNLLNYNNPLLQTISNKSKLFTQQNINIVIENLMSNRIKEEISNASYVALIFDELSNISDKSKVSVVVRYVDDKYDVQERFISFVDFGKRTIPVIKDVFVKIVEDLNVSDKLTAFTYDGAAVDAENMTSLNNVIKELYPSANFVYNYNYPFNLILVKSYLNREKFRVFFQTIISLSKFFKIDTNRSLFLTKYYLDFVLEDWSLAHKFVITVTKLKCMFISFFEDVIKNNQIWNYEDIIKASGYLAFLEDVENTFLLEAMSYIFTRTLVLDQITEWDLLLAKSNFKNLVTKLTEYRNNGFSELWDDIFIDSDVEIEFQNTKRDLFKFAINITLMHIKIRFSLINTTFFKLLNFKSNDNFVYRNVEAIVSGTNNDKLFDLNCLRNELTVCQSSKEFNEAASPREVLLLIDKYDAFSVLPQIANLAKLILTQPSKASSPDKTESYINKILKYYKKLPNDADVSSQALLYIEEQFLMTLKAQPNFYEELYINYMKTFCK